MNAPPVGAYLLAPGLHYLGVDDPRIDRFCRILASLGFAVASANLDDMRALRVTRASIEQFGAALDWFGTWTRKRGVAPPALFSISFGSMPAIRVAADARWRDQVRAVVTFGGYGDFEGTARFALTGQTWAEGAPCQLPCDPLNDPAIFINLVEYLVPAEAVEPLRRAWLEMTERTWGRPASRRTAIRRPIAERIAAHLPDKHRHLFLVGCGLEPGGAQLFEEAMSRARASFDFADLRAPAASLRVPLTAIHGRDDDVIPWPEAVRLQQAASATGTASRFITGAYAHTESSFFAWRQAPAEIRSLLGILDTLSNAPLG